MLILRGLMWLERRISPRTRAATSGETQGPSGHRDATD
jgi:hypothetical protein